MFGTDGNFFTEYFLWLFESMDVESMAPEGQLHLCLHPCGSRSTLGGKWAEVERKAHLN